MTESVVQAHDAAAMAMSDAEFALHQSDCGMCEDFGRPPVTFHALVATELHPNGLPKRLAALCGARDGAAADTTQKVTCLDCLANGTSLVERAAIEEAAELEREIKAEREPK